MFFLQSGDFRLKDRRTSDSGDSRTESSGSSEVITSATRATMDNSTSRLVDWNVNTLAHLLGKVIAGRSSSGKRETFSTLDYVHSAGDSFLDEVLEVVPIAKGKHELSERRTGRTF